MTKGKIWPEYWIDCAKCDHHEPLGVRTKDKAENDAVYAGWCRIRGVWYCKRCAGAVAMAPAQCNTGAD